MVCIYSKISSSKLFYFYFYFYIYKDRLFPATTPKMHHIHVFNGICICLLVSELGAHHNNTGNLDLVLPRMGMIGYCDVQQALVTVELHKK